MTRPCSYRNSRQGPRRLAFGSLICGNGQISKIENERARVAVAARYVRRVWASYDRRPAAVPSRTAHISARVK